MTEAAQVARCRGLVFYWAKRLLRAGKAAGLGFDDLVSLGDEGLVRGIRSHDPRAAALETWVSTKIKYGMKEGIRAAKGRRRWKGAPLVVPSFVPLDAALGVSTNAASVGTELAERDEWDHLTAGLKRNERRLLSEYYRDGRTQLELARARGLTEGGVFKQVKRIHGKIKKKLERA